MKNARAKRAKILFFTVKYANLWGFRCRRRRRGCLSSLLLIKKLKRHLLERGYLINFTKNTVLRIDTGSLKKKELRQQQRKKKNLPLSYTIPPLSSKC